MRVVKVKRTPKQRTTESGTFMPPEQTKGRSKIAVKEQEGHLKKVKKP